MKNHKNTIKILHNYSYKSESCDSKEGVKNQGPRGYKETSCHSNLESLQCGGGGGLQLLRHGSQNGLVQLSEGGVECVYGNITLLLARTALPVRRKREREKGRGRGREREKC